MSKYLDTCKWEYNKNKTEAIFIYDRKRAEENWKKIKENIDKGLANPIKIDWSKDGYEVPFGRDCFLNYGELMPDGVISDYSIFYRDPLGEFPWLGNYYNLCHRIITVYGETPLSRYDKEIENNLRLIREFGTKTQSFTKDNNTSIN